MDIAVGHTLRHHLPPRRSTHHHTHLTDSDQLLDMLPSLAMTKTEQAIDFSRGFLVTRTRSELVDVIQKFSSLSVQLDHCQLLNYIQHRPQAQLLLPCMDQYH